MKIGVLALQGDFREHRYMLEGLGVEVVEVRQVAHLEGVTGLVVPGGESSVIGMLALEGGIETTVRQRVLEGTLAVWGTCAGAIWLAKTLPKFPQQPRLGMLDISVSRNAYGRQVDSFATPVSIESLVEPFEVYFIRAPMFDTVGNGVQVLASHEGKAVMVRQDNLLATTFHPEMGSDSRVHQYFVAMCEKLVKN